MMVWYDMMIWYDIDTPRDPVLAAIEQETNRWCVTHVQHLDFRVCTITHYMLHDPPNRSFIPSVYHYQSCACDQCVCIDDTDTCNANDSRET